MDPLQGPTCTAGMDAEYRVPPERPVPEGELLPQSQASDNHGKAQGLRGVETTANRRAETAGSGEREAKTGSGPLASHRQGHPMRTTWKSKSGAAWRAWDEQRRSSYPSSHLIPTVPRRTRRKGDSACRVQSRGGHPITFISF